MFTNFEIKQEYLILSQIRIHILVASVVYITYYTIFEKVDITIRYLWILRRKKTKTISDLYECVFINRVNNVVQSYILSCIAKLKMVTKEEGSKILTYIIIKRQSPCRKGGENCRFYFRSIIIKYYKTHIFFVTGSLRQIYLQL